MCVCVCVCVYVCVCYLHLIGICKYVTIFYGLACLDEGHQQTSLQAADGAAGTGAPKRGGSTSS